MAFLTWLGFAVFLIASYGVARGIYLMMKESRRTAAIAAMTVIVMGVVGIQLWLRQDVDINKSTRLGWKQVMSVAMMYDLKSRFDQSSPAEQAKLRPKLLEACGSAVGTYGVFRAEYTFPPLEVDAMRRAGYDQYFESAAGTAAITIVEESKDFNDRACALDNLCNYLAPHNGYRMWGELAGSNCYSVTDVFTKLGPNRERFAAYCLSGWYSKIDLSEKALSKLNSALGKDWSSTGKVNEWWVKKLPLVADDHLYLGYVLYQNNKHDWALREYRAAKGSKSSTKEMLECYRAGYWQQHLYAQR